MPELSALKPHENHDANIHPSKGVNKILEDDSDEEVVEGEDGNKEEREGRQYAYTYIPDQVDESEIVIPSSDHVRNSTIELLGKHDWNRFRE